MAHQTFSRPTQNPSNPSSYTTNVRSLGSEIGLKTVINNQKLLSSGFLTKFRRHFQTAGQRKIPKHSWQILDAEAHLSGVKFW